MRSSSIAFGLLLAGLTCLVGCGRVVFSPNQAQQTVKLSPQEQQKLAAQNQLWQQRAGQVDQDNQELESLLAQSRQQIQLLRDLVHATRDRLKATTVQLADSRSKNQSLEKRTQALAASVTRRTAAEIRPNNSLVRDLSIAHLPGVVVRPDGDVVRIELSTDQLFQASSPRLQSDARSLLQSVAAEISRQYPQQIVGIEGHASRDLVRTAQFPSSHHLTVAQAMVIYDVLVREARVSPNRLFVIGHGSNHPVVSNATPGGRKRNCRIELVIYPETVARR